jgi:hypothetical protein
VNSGVLLKTNFDLSSSASHLHVTFTTWRNWLLRNARLIVYVI